MRFETQKNSPTMTGQEPRVAQSREFFVGASSAVLTLQKIISEIAPTSIPVLLVGESGTGKEMFAHYIHEISRRRAESFVKIACSSVNAESLAAELGHASVYHNDFQKSFGSLLFDEISELDAACQRILLYSLPDGEPKLRPGMIAARVISTTTKKLDEEIKADRFRSELYYRLNGVCLRLPPLRERKEDIPMLTEFFLRKHAAQLRRPRPIVSERTLRMFLDHSWPGNIREFENVVKNIVALGEEELGLSALAVEPSLPAPQRASANDSHDSHARSLKVAAKAASREAERDLILQALARTRWNRKRAAQELQISYKSLLYKLKQIGLPDSEAN